MPFAGPITADVCAKYNTDGYCFGAAYCADVDGQPQCQCPDNYVGDRCDLPGPGYDTTPDFLPQLEAMQFGLVVVGLVMAMVSLAVTGYSVFKVVRQRGSNEVRNMTHLCMLLYHLFARRTTIFKHRDTPPAT
jgi:hypothetical protein